MKRVEHRVEFKRSPSMMWTKTDPMPPSYADELVNLFHTQGWQARVEVTRIDKELR